MASIRPKVFLMVFTILIAFMILPLLSWVGQTSAPKEALAAGKAPFYKGKTMRMIVPSSPGGGYDTYT